MSNANKEKEAPIIIVKKKGKGHAGGHGGSWKVAFADFATAMMAFFLVMWLMANTTPVEKKAIAAYFTQPDKLQLINSHASPNLINTHADVSTTLSTGSSNSIDDQKLMYDQSDSLQTLQRELEADFDDSEALSRYRDQVVTDVTPLGLRIQILDNAKIPMFESGSSDLNENIENVLHGIAPALNQMDNKIIIEGYTDGLPFSNQKYFSNWELSSGRANAARRALIKGGLSENHISEVVGRASTILYNPDKPGDPTNRRISILLLNKDAQNLLNQPEQVFENNRKNSAKDDKVTDKKDVVDAQAPNATPDLTPAKPAGPTEPEAKPAPAANQSAATKDVPAAPSALKPEGVAPTSNKPNAGSE